jgi:hypothetical protein
MYLLFILFITSVHAQAAVTLLTNFLQCAAVHQHEDRINHISDPTFKKFPTSAWNGPGWRIINGSVAMESGLVTTLYCVYPTTDEPIMQSISFKPPNEQDVSQGQLTIETTHPTPILVDESILPFLKVLLKFPGSSTPPFTWSISGSAPPISSDSTTTSWVVERGTYALPSFPIPPDTQTIQVSLYLSINGSACIRTVSLTYSHLGDTVLQTNLNWSRLALFLLSIVNSTIAAIYFSRNRTRWLRDWGNIILLRRIPIYGGSRWVPILHILAASPFLWDTLRNVAQKKLPLVDSPTLGPLVPIVYIVFVIVQAYSWWGPLLCWSAIVTSAGRNGRLRRIQAASWGVWSLVIMLAQLYVFAVYRTSVVGPRMRALALVEIIMSSFFYIAEMAWFVQQMFGTQPLWIKTAVKVFNYSPEQVCNLDDSFEALMFRDCAAYVRATFRRVRDIGEPVPGVVQGSKAPTPNFSTISPWPTDIIRFPPTVFQLLTRFARSVQPKAKSDYDDPFWHMLSMRLILGVTLFPIQAILLLTGSATIWIEGLGFMCCLLATFTDPTLSQVLATADRLEPILMPIVIVVIILLMFLVLHHQFSTVRNYIITRARLRLGDYGMIPTGKLAFNHGDDRKLRGGMGILQSGQFVGYCVGFGLFGLVWTIIVTMLLFIFVALIVLAVVAVPSVQRVIIDYLTSSIFIAAVFAAILATLLRVAQRLLVAYTSVIPGSTTSIRYNSPYIHLDYLFIYIDAILGVLAFLKRLLLGLFSSAFYATRVDISIITDDLKTSDGGLASFEAMTVTDHGYQNDIVMYFALTLIRQRRGRIRREHLDEFDEVYDPDAEIAQDAHNALIDKTVNSGLADVAFAPGHAKDIELDQMESHAAAEKHLADQDHLRRQRAINRWFVAYTLIRNPQLGIYRKHFGGGKPVLMDNV